MIKKIHLTALGLLSVIYSNAQISFERKYNGFGGGYAVQTSDGGYFIQNGQLSGFDLFIKTDSLGDTLWTKQFGINVCGLPDGTSTSAAQTTDGGFISSGNTCLMLGYLSMYVTKIDSQGYFKWARYFTYPFCNCWASIIHATHDGGCIFTFTNRDDITLQPTGFIVVKLNVFGNTDWEEELQSVNGESISGIIETHDGNYVLSGETVSQGHYDRDIFLLKLNPTGALIWARKIGGVASEAAGGVRETFDHGYVLSGYFDSTSIGKTDMLLVKTDSSGEFSWAKRFGTGLFDYGGPIIQENDSGFVLAGMINDSGWTYVRSLVVRTDQFGDTLWTKVIGPNNQLISSISHTTDGGFVLAGGQAIIKTNSTFSDVCYQSSGIAMIVDSVPMTDSIVIRSMNPITIGSPATVDSLSGITTQIDCISTSVGEFAKTNLFELFPNPSSGIFNIHWKEANLKGRVEIENILGKCVYSKSIANSTDEIINLSNEPSGIYLVRFIGGNNFFTRKIVIY